MPKMHSVLVEKRLANGLVIGIRFSSEKLEDLYDVINYEENEKNKKKRY